MARPIDVVSNAVDTRANRELAARKERDLALPEGFIGEVLQSGGVIGIYFNLRSRERFGWTGSATGGKVINSRQALRGLHGDGFVNTWSPNSDTVLQNTGLHTINVNLVDPEDENPKSYARPVGKRDAMSIALDGAECADAIAERISRDPLIVEAEILDSSWLTVSRLGLHAMIDTVHPDGYLAKALPKLDEIVFERTHLTKKESLARWDDTLTYSG